jgi:hypothetical protein
MRLRAYEKICDICRRLGQIHQFSPHPYLIMQAALGGGIHASAAWQNAVVQKFISRELRIFEEAANGYKMKYVIGTERWSTIIQTGLTRRMGDDAAQMDDGDEDEEDGGVKAKGKGRKKVTTGVLGEEGENEMEGEDADSDEEGEEDGEDGDGEAADGMEGEEQMAGKTKSGRTVKPKTKSPAFNAIYGQYMLSSKSYQSALCE